MNSFVKLVNEAVREFTPTDNAFKPSAEELLQEQPVQIWDKREQEPGYAKLSGQEEANQKAKLLNVYDQPIDLIALVQQSEPEADVSSGQSLYINGNPAVGDNPNRNKQHGFYFTADNCIGCHACESACAEKNETPAHLAFRSVGYVEGGTYPDFQRMNISMACNHCDDPVCLKGCPTMAYTKHTEYGAVLQDPDTCFGCGYCTWVCPYNAPQLDPIEGQVSKCNMCVDRLEVGLKPACVSACVGNALDFGVVEDIPENREQANVSIPGFPDPEITRPNIRFQQKTGMPEEMHRTDSASIKYHKDQQSGKYKPTLDPKHGFKRSWHLGLLNSRENPLVLFTLTTQMGIGAFLISFLGALLGIDSAVAFANTTYYAWVPFAAAGLAALGLLLSTTHLGKPMRFYRGFNNLRYSPVSREGLGVAIFIAFAGLHWLFSLLPLNNALINGLEVISGLMGTIGAMGGLYYMYRCYRIKARPFWDHWQTATTFVGSALTLGSLLCVALTCVAGLSGFNAYVQTLQFFGLTWLLGLMLEGVGLLFHAKANKGAEHEGASSHYEQTTTFGKTYILRNALLGMLVIVSAVLVLSAPQGLTAIFSWSVVAMFTLIIALIGRALFYVLVVPTSMPGGFFWRNKGFEKHALETGLVDVVDVGLVRSNH